MQIMANVWGFHYANPKRYEQELLSVTFIQTRIEPEVTMRETVFGRQYDVLMNR